MDATLRRNLLSLYDAPSPGDPSRIAPGYDKAHAERASRIVRALADELAVPRERLPDLEVTCLLHDLGRAGMDPHLFGRIFRLAEERGVPVRLSEMRERYPDLDEAHACGHFLDLMAPAFHEAGIEITPAVADHVAMRLDFKGRLRRVLAECGPKLAAWGVAIHPWMEKVMLYYYYPALIEDEPEETRRMGMMLVAGENFEAYNNHERARDYYLGRDASLAAVFDALDVFQRRGIVNAVVMDALRRLTASGRLDGVIKESRGMVAADPLPPEDRAFQRALSESGSA